MWAGGFWQHLLHCTVDVVGVNDVVAILKGSRFVATDSVDAEICSCTEPRIAWGEDVLLGCLRRVEGWISWFVEDAGYREESLLVVAVVSEESHSGFPGFLSGGAVPVNFGFEPIVLMLLEHLLVFVF